MTDFNFLRIKWPKLAAIAADAGRLVEVSPASAISTMQNFCEWAADIALDFYDVDTQNGITQQEKLETLKAIGHVPADVLARFHNIMMSGGRRLYRVNEDVEEARRCIDDVYEIGRWLNKEADRAGWPPKNDYYRPVISSMGLPMDSGNFATGRMGQLWNNFKPLIVMGIAAVVVVVALIIILPPIIKSASAKPFVASVTPTPPIVATATLSATDMATPSPAPETFVYLDTLTPSKTQQTFFLKKWHFQKSGDTNFTIGDKSYEDGIGMYIPSKSISAKQGTWYMTFKLDGTYNRLRFDLGVDTLQYGDGYGSYRIQIFCNSSKTAAYDSGLNTYDFTAMGQDIDITGCTTLKIQLTEKKGTKGTINAVLGNIRLVQGGDATATDSATGTGEPDDSTSPSPSVSPSASASADASATTTDTSSGEPAGQ